MTDFAVRLHRTGGPEVLQYEAVDVGAPAAGEARVRQHAIGVNFIDIYHRTGLYPLPLPSGLGLEAAGVIEAVGPGVGDLAPGDRVAYAGGPPGAYAQVRNMPADRLVPLPDAIDFDTAAALMLKGLTAHYLLRRTCRVEAGDAVLIHAAAGGVGLIACQWARALGARVIGTSGSPDKLRRLQALGLDVPLATREPDFAPAVMRATGDHGADLVVNTVGGSVFAECVRSMAFEGRLATVGYVDRTLKAELDIQALHARRLTLFGVSNKLRNADQRAAGVPAFAADLLPAIADGRIVPLVDRVFDFDELPAAKAHMESNLHLGKIVLRIAG